MSEITALPGEVLRELQLKSGLSQRQFARQFGIKFDLLHSKISNAQQREVRYFGREYLKPSPYPIFDKPLEMEGDAVIIPDPEFPFHHAEFMNNVLALGEAWGIRQCIIAGDALHFNSISKWEPSWTVPSKGGLSEIDEAEFMERVQRLPSKYQGEMLAWMMEREDQASDTRSVSEEVGIAKKCMTRLGELFDRVDYVIGNHDCIDEETEVFSGNCWKKYTDLIPGKSSVLVYNNGTITEETISNLHVYDFDGNLFHTKTMLVDMAVTDNHRVLWRPPEGKWRFEEANRLWNKNKTTRLFIPTGGKKQNKGIKLSDAEIRIAAWVLTDCTIDKHGYYRFFQRESKYHLITKLLDAIGLHYTIFIRDRNTKSICGKELLKRPEKEITVLVDADSSRSLSKIINSKECVPDWSWNMNDHQFEEFLGAYIDGDGSIHKNSPNSKMIYCNREVLAGQIQALCLTHGYRATISKYNGDNTRINIFKRPVISVDGGYVKNTSKQYYKGKVWCVTVPSGNFLVRRNGRPFFTGNSRLLSALDSPLFAGALLDMIGLHDPKWRIAPYYYSVLYSGGETWRIEHPKSAAQNTAVQLASKYLCNVAMGHSHGWSHSFDASGSWHAIQMGCCVDERRLPYAAQRSTSGKAHMLGALIIRAGQPYLLHERSDWGTLISMK